MEGATTQVSEPSSKPHQQALDLAAEAWDIKGSL